MSNASPDTTCITVLIDAPRSDCLITRGYPPVRDQT